MYEFQVVDVNVGNNLPPIAGLQLAHCGQEEEDGTLQMHPINRAIIAQMTSDWPGWFVAALQHYPLPIERAVVVPDLLQQWIEVRAARLVELPLRHVSIAEQCGRVFLINIVSLAGSYEPEPAPRVRVVNVPPQWGDPEIPLPLLPLGDKAEQAMAEYVKHLNIFEQILMRRERNAVHEWWTQANELCGACVECVIWSAARVGMTIEEVIYSALKLQRSLAWPQGTELLMVQH